MTVAVCAIQVAVNAKEVVRMKPHNLAGWLSLLLAVGLMVPAANAGFISVPDDYTSIAAACQAAVAGDTVGVYAGTYYSYYASVKPGVTLLGMEDDSTLVKVIATGPYGAALRFSSVGDPAPAYIENMEIHTTMPNGVGVNNENPSAVIQRCFLYNHDPVDISWVPVVETDTDVIIRKSHIYHEYGSDSELFRFFDVAHILIEDCVIELGQGTYSSPRPGSVLEFKNNIFLRDFWTGIHSDDRDCTLLLVNNIFIRGAYASSNCYPNTIEWRYNDFVTEAPDPDCGYQVGNFSADPEFCGPDDYRLQPDSPCRNAGENGEDVGARWGICWTPQGVEDEDLPLVGGRWVSQARPNPSSRGVRVLIEADGHMLVTVDVLDPTGSVVRRLSGSHAPKSKRVYRWDGRTAHGSLAPSGVYYLRVTGGLEDVGRRVIVLR